MTREEAIKIVEHFDDTLWQIDNKVTIGKIADAIQVLVNAEADYTEQMRQLNEEWKENMAIQKQMLIDKVCKWLEKQEGALVLLKKETLVELRKYMEE